MLPSDNKHFHRFKLGYIYAEIIPKLIKSNKDKPIKILKISKLSSNPINGKNIISESHTKLDSAWPKIQAN